MFFVGSTFAQHTNFNTQRNWSLNKKEIMFGFGATQFLGDLGGRDQIGTDYSLVDIDWPSTFVGGMLGYRYRFHPYWATTTSLNIGMLKGDDALTNEIVRRERNLHFRSMVFEIHQRIECIIVANEKFGARYNIPGLKGFKNHNEQIYLFTGLGINYFNPKALYNGQWTALRPLHTEGQGLAEHYVFPLDGENKMQAPPKQYLPVTATIPFGIGLRMGMGRMWRIGIEATYVKTFSDYIDDVSGYYYDPDALAANYGQASADLANRSTGNTTWFYPGQVRGHDEKDAYFYLNLVFAKNVTYKDYAKQRKMVKWKGRYKF
jgi:hypothetical protein